MSTILFFPEQPRPMIVSDISDLWVEILQALWNNRHRYPLNMREVSQETGLPVHIVGSALLEMQRKEFVTDEASPFWRYELDGKGLWVIMSLVAVGRGQGFHVKPACSHDNRDQAMSCPRYFDGTHGANHFDIASDQAGDIGVESAKDSAPLLSCLRAGMDGFIARVNEVLDRETALAEPQDATEIFSSNGRQI